MILTPKTLLMSLMACLLGGLAFVVTRAQLASTPNHYVGHDKMVVECTGTTDGWVFHQPGADSRFDTADDTISHNSLTLPADTTVELRLRSDDYLFRLAQKDLKLNAIALPDQEMTTILETKEPGIYELELGAMCGSPFLHPTERPRIVISRR